MILTLLEKQSGLLTFAKIDTKCDRSFADVDFIRHFAMNDIDALVEAFERADFRIVSRENPARVQRFSQEIDDERRSTIGRLRECLNDEIHVVAVRVAI